MDLMRLRLVFIIFQLFGRSFLAGIIIKPSKLKESCNLVEAVVRVVRRCYGTKVNPIGLVDTSPDGLLVASMTSNEDISIILLDNTTRTVNDRPVSRLVRSKLQIFVITISLSTELEGILVNIKKSRWRNHMAYFYILELSGKEDGCSKAFEILRTAWRMNLLEAKFLCTHRTKGRLIYSFNPYTSDAPDPWRLERTYSDENDHPWTLLTREYREDDDPCENMDFDKSRDLGGYEIRVTVKNKTWEVSVNENKTGVDSLSGTIGEVARSIFRHLNATAKLMIHDGNDPFGCANDTENTYEMVEELANGITDFTLQSISTFTLAKLTSLYPYYRSGLSVMTRYNRRKSQLSKIASVIDISSRICLCIVCLITPIFLKWFLRQNLAIAILNTIRMICNAALTKLSNGPSARIYLTGLFVFVVTIQGIYQGQLASSLAKEIRLPDVDSRLDLAESHHKIYGHYSWDIHFVSEAAFKGRYVPITGYNCTEYVLRDPNAACIIFWDEGVTEAARTKLHLSKQMVYDSDITWAIRKYWPLEQKFNIILRRIVESNVYKYSVGRSLEKSIRTLKHNDNENIDRACKTLTLADLTFAFVILGVGLGCAAISFIVEIGITTLPTKFKKARIESVTLANSAFAGKSAIRENIDARRSIFR